MNTAAISVESLSRLKPLGTLGEKHLQEISPLCRHDHFKRNLDPLHEHEWAGRVMYLMKGQMRVDSADGSREVLVGGHDSALFPVYWNGRRPVRAKAITDVEVMSLEEEPLDIVITWDQVAQASQQDEASDMAAPEWRRMSGMFSLANLTSGVLAALPVANIDALLQQFEPVVVHRGDVIIRQGDPGDFYYLISRGRCSVTRLISGAVVNLASITEGDAFGEEALLAGSLRNATVTMKTDGVLLRLNKDVFNKMLREPLIKSVDLATAEKQVAEGAVWIDARYPAEFQANGLSGAINIPISAIRQASSLLDAKKHYVVYCQTGRRSAAATFLLSQRGVNAVLLKGGLNAMSKNKELGR